MQRTLQNIGITEEALPPTSAAVGCAISVVTMVYRSAAYLPEFLALSRQALQAVGLGDHEIIFVNDGSPDASLEYLLEQRAKDPRIKIVDLSRNFGHHKAALAGMSHATGSLVFLIDCDLEVSPLCLQKLLDTQAASSADVVYGVQERRKGGLIERVGGSLFWKLYNMLSDTKVPESVLTERVMTRNYVNALTGLGDRNIFLAGMMHWAGFRQVGVPLQKGLRTGKTTYTLRKRFGLLLEAITSFSTIPLQAVLASGLGLTLCSGMFAVGLVVRKLLYPESLLTGFTTLAVLIIGIGGIIIMLMGILGLYISRIFVQTQGRPTYIVREYYGGKRHE